MDEKTPDERCAIRATAIGCLLILLFFLYIFRHDQAAYDRASERINRFSEYIQLDQTLENFELALKKQ